MVSVSIIPHLFQSGSRRPVPNATDKNVHLNNRSFQTRTLSQSLDLLKNLSRLPRCWNRLLLFLRVVEACEPCDVRVLTSPTPLSSPRNRQINRQKPLGAFQRHEKINCDEYVLSVRERDDGKHIVPREHT